MYLNTLGDSEIRHNNEIRHPLNIIIHLASLKFVTKLIVYIIDNVLSLRQSSIGSVNCTLLQVAKLRLNLVVVANSLWPSVYINTNVGYKLLTLSS